MMSTLMGLKLVTRNEALNSTIRRHRRIPWKIDYYSRFAQQLNLFRYHDSGKKSDGDQSKFNNLYSGESSYVVNNPDRFKIQSSILITTSSRFDCNNDDDIEDNREDGSRSSWSERDSKLSNQSEIEINKKNDRDKFDSTEPIINYENSFGNQSSFYKVFNDNINLNNENNYIYNHIHRRLNRLASMCDQISDLPVYPSIEKLKNILKKDTQNDEDSVKKQESIDESLEIIHSFIKYSNQQELAILLTYIKNEMSPEFVQIKRMIDIELKWLLKTNVKTRLMDLDLYFYCSDIFYECLMKSTFVSVLVNYLVSENDLNMTNSQFLHLLFLVILQKKHEHVLSKYESRIMEVVKNCSFEDIATICMAYFKTRTSINDHNILEAIINRTTDLLPDVVPEEPGYSAIIKSIRYSFRMHRCRKDVARLVMRLSDPENSKIIMANNYNLVQTCKLMESFKIYDRGILDILYRTLFINTDSIRIKDIQYGLTTLSNFSYNDLVMTETMKEDFDNLSRDIVQSKRLDHIAQFAHLSPLLRAFAIFGYYNDDLLRYTYDNMSNDYEFSLMKDTFEFDKSALLIYSAAYIEGPHLATKFIEKKSAYLPVLKKITKSIIRGGNVGSVRSDSTLSRLKFILADVPNELYMSKTYRQISQALESNRNFTDSSYRFDFQFTLPHQNFADLIISKDGKNPGDFDEETLEARKLPEGARHCVIFLTNKFDFLDGHQRLSGFKRLHARLLEKLGYSVIQCNSNHIDIEDIALKVRKRLNG